MKQVYRNVKKCCIFTDLEISRAYVFVRLQIQYLLIAGLNSDDN